MCAQGSRDLQSSAGPAESDERPTLFAFNALWAALSKHEPMIQHCFNDGSGSWTAAQQ